MWDSAKKKTPQELASKNGLPVEFLLVSSYLPNWKEAREKMFSYHINNGVDRTS